MNTKVETDLRDQPSNKKGNGRFKGKGASKSGGSFNRNHRVKSADEIRVENDVAWHSKYPELFSDATNIAQAYFIGKQYEAIHKQDSNGIISAKYLRQTALAVIHNFLTPGYCNGSNYGINLQARALWIAERNKFRGLGSYQQADLGIVLFGLIDFFASLAQAERLYGIMRRYDVEKRQLPQAYLKAYGLGTFTLGSESIAKFRYSLNTLIEAAHTLCVPTGISALEDAVTLYSCIFQDRESRHSQEFMYLKQGYWLLDEASISTGTALKFVQSRATLGSLTLDSYIEELETQLKALLNSDVVTVVCTDLVSCFADNRIVRLEPLPTDYKVMPVYSEERSLQFHNLDLANIDGGEDYPIANGSPTQELNAEFGNGKLWIYQFDNGIYFVPSETAGTSTKQIGNLWYRVMANAGDVINSHIFDDWKDAITETDFMVGTRMKCRKKTLFVTGTNDAALVFYNFGLYINTKIIFTYYEGSDNTYGYSYEVRNLNVTGIPTNFEMMLSSITSFANGPIITFNRASGEVLQVIGDYDHLVMIPDDTLRDLNDVSMLSLFKVETEYFKEQGPARK